MSQRLNLKTKRVRARYSLFAGVIDVQHRLPKFIGMFPSQLGASAQETLKAENQGAIAFLDVLPGSRRIRAGPELNQLISCPN
jgi:hypothetical protein